MIGSVTAGELADICGLDPASIRYHCRDPRGALHTVARKVGRAWMIPIDAADAFAATYRPYGTLRRQAGPDSPPESGPALCSSLLPPELKEV